MSLLFGARIKEPKNVCFEGEDKDEKVLLTLRQHPIRNLRWIASAVVLALIPFVFTSLDNSLLGSIPAAFVFVASVLWYLFVFGYTFTSFLVWYYSVYMVTNKKVLDLDFQGFVSRRFSEALLTNIEDLTHEVSGPLQVVFNYGTLSIQTAGEYREIEFDYIPNPSEVQDFVSDLAGSLRKKYRANA